MISFERFIPETGGMPIYLQIIRYIKRGMVAGVIADGDEVPSRRILSATLGINPNTVQKAYRMLEAEGLMISRTGAKSVISLSPEALFGVREEVLREDARRAVRLFRAAGLDMAEAEAMIRQYWDDPGDPPEPTPEEGEEA